MMERKRALRFLFIGVTIAALLVFLFLVQGFRPKSPEMGRQQVGQTSSHGSPDPSPDRTVTKRDHETAISAPLLVMRKDPSEIAFAKIKNGFKKIVASRTFTETTTILETDGARRRTMTMVLSCAKDENGSILLRGETICYDPKTNTPDSKQHRIEISNAEGNWELRGADAIQDVAFLHLDDTEALSSVGMYKAAVATANGDMDPSRSYSERNEVYHGRSSTIVSETINAVPGLVFEYVIDRTTETLVQMNLNSISAGPIMETIFKTDPQLSPSLFEVPDSKLILPTKDIESDAMAISKEIK